MSFVLSRQPTLCLQKMMDFFLQSLKFMHKSPWMPGESVMQPQTDRSLVELLLKQAKEQNALLFDLQTQENEKKFQRIKEMIGHTMGSTYADALYWVFKEHPNLKPEGMPDSA